MRWKNGHDILDAFNWLYDLLLLAAALLSFAIGFRKWNRRPMDLATNDA